MSDDTNANTGQGADQSGTNDVGSNAGDLQAKYDRVRAEAEDLRRKYNGINPDEYRALKDANQTLQAQFEELQEQVGQKDPEMLKEFKKQVRETALSEVADELKEAREKAESAIRSNLEYRIENELHKTGLFADGAVEMVKGSIVSDVKLENGELVFVDGEGNVKYKPGTTEPMKLKDWAETVTKERPFLAAPSIKSGSGIESGNKNKANGAPVHVPTDFHTWSQDKKTEWMRENPEGAKEVIKGIRLN